MQNAIEYTSSRVSEVYVDLPTDAIRHIAKREDVEYVILRVQVFGPSGRPSTRSLRLHRSLLEDDEYDPFN